MIRMSDVQRIEQAPVPASPRDVAQRILAGFDRHYALFRYSAQRAKSLYESGDWHGIQRLSRERIEYYDMRVRECTAQLEGAARPPGGATAGTARTRPTANPPRTAPAARTAGPPRWTMRRPRSGSR